MAPTAPVKADRVRTALLCALGCGLFAVANACAKAALTVLPGPELHPLQITAARFLFGALALLPFILRAGPNVLRSAVPLRHVQRIAFGLGGVTSMFFAVQAIPLADATAIGRTAPLFTLLFAGLLMKEGSGGMRWLAAGIGFAGVVVIMQPTVATFNLANLIPILAAFCTGAEVATIRILALRDKALTILALNNAGGAAIACLAATFIFVTPSWQQGLALVGVGVAMVSGQALIVRAFLLHNHRMGGAHRHRFLRRAYHSGLVPRRKPDCSRRRYRRHAWAGRKQGEIEIHRQGGASAEKL